MKRFPLHLFAEPWAIDKRHLESLVALVRDTAVARASASPFEDEKEDEGEEEIKPKSEGLVAIVPIKGYILKSVPGWFSEFGIEATSTNGARSVIRKLAGDPSISSIVLDVDSPGGTTGGLAELSDAIFEARSKKPVHAHVSDLGASAAYWIASQTERVTAGPMSWVGSIGTYTYVYDFSKLLESNGVKAHVVSSHELKGAGIPGSPVTEAQLADMQRMIDQITNNFVDHVARGRGMASAKVRDSATGQVWHGDEAKNRGLIDAVSTLDQAIEAAAKAGAAHQQKSSTTTKAPTGARGNSMDIETLAKQVESLTGAVTQLATRAESAEKLLVEARAHRRTAMLEKYSNRIAPAQKAGIEDYAVACGDDVAKLESFLSALPVVVNPTAKGSSPAPTPDNMAAIIERGQSRANRALGVDDGTSAKWANVQEVTVDGRVVLTDGRSMLKADFEKLSIAAA